MERGHPARLDAPNHSISFDADTIAKALVNIYQKKYGNGSPDIEPTLFEKTKEILSGAVNTGVAGQRSGKPSDAFIHALTHSTDVFSAFRVHNMQSKIASYLVDSKGKLKPFGQFVKDVKPYITHQNRQWLQTEYDTAVRRAHLAADWQRFEDEKDVLPNLEWKPSTSPNPGEDHKPYWGTILPVDHEFWNQHRPGDRWNCKCSLRNTDKQRTAIPVEHFYKNTGPQKGLDTNPGTTGEIFSTSHPYFPENCGVCPFNKGVGKLFAALVGGEKHCFKCKRSDMFSSQVKLPKNIFNEDEKQLQPPQSQDYYKYDDNVFHHPLHGENEYRANLETALLVSRILEAPVWLLPRINANTEQDRQQRAILLPFAKPKKNPDYFICGHTFDAKDMFNIEAKTKVDVKKSIIKHIQKAKDQADNIILRMPKWIKRSWIYQAVNGFFNQSKHERIIIVLINNKSIIFKKNLPNK